MPPTPVSTHAPSTVYDPLLEGRLVHREGPPAVPFSRRRRALGVLAAFVASALIHEGLFWWAGGCAGPAALVPLLLLLCPCRCRLLQASAARLISGSARSARRRYPTGHWTPGLRWFWHFTLWGGILVGENAASKALKCAWRGLLVRCRLAGGLRSPALDRPAPPLHLRAGRPASRCPPGSPWRSFRSCVRLLRCWAAGLWVAGSSRGQAASARDPPPPAFCHPSASARHDGGLVVPAAGRRRHHGTGRSEYRRDVDPHHPRRPRPARRRRRQAPRAVSAGGGTAAALERCR